VEDPTALRAGRAFPLPGGSRLEVKVATGVLGPELHLTRDGVPVPGSATDPKARHAAATQTVFTVAAISAVGGLLVELLGVSVLEALGVGWSSVLAAGVFAALGAQVRRGSALALGVAAALFAADGVLMLALSAQVAGTPPVGGLVMRGFLLVPMLRGIPALRELERPAQRLPPVLEMHADPLAEAPPGRPLAPAASAATRRTVKDMVERAAPRASAAPSRRGQAPAPRGGADADAAAKAFRFRVHKCEIGDGGLAITLASGSCRELRFADIERLVVRTLPPDPPWSGMLVLDVVAASANGHEEPARLVATTYCNFGALPEGAATARVENFRRLVRHLRERNPGLLLDAETARFADGAPPARFASLAAFAAYDASYA
jgi:hypothetical protein